MQTTSVAKDFHRLMKRIGRLTDGQAAIDEVDWDEGTLQKFALDISPNAGYYKGGKFKFTIHLPDDFPSDRPPVVWCETDIYHPNIDTTETSFDEESDTNVCLNLLDHGTWRPSYGLEGLVLGLVFLMHHPNTADPLSPYFDGYVEEEEYAANVKKYMTGKEIDGVTFKVDFCVKEQNENLSKETVGESEKEINSNGDSKVNEIVDDIVQSKEVDILKDTVENSDDDNKRIEPTTDGEDAKSEVDDVTTDIKEGTKTVIESNEPGSSENNDKVDDSHRITDRFDASVKLATCENLDEINDTKCMDNAETEMISSEVTECDHEHVTNVDEKEICECDEPENTQENKGIHEVLPGQSNENEINSDTLSVEEHVKKLNSGENKQVHDKIEVAHMILDELIYGVVNSDSSDDTDDDELGVKMVYIDGECMLLTEKEYEGEHENSEREETDSDVDCDEKNEENDVENQDDTHTDATPNEFDDMNGRSETGKISDDDIDGAKCNTELCGTKGASKCIQKWIVTAFHFIFMSLKLHYESL